MTSPKKPLEKASSWVRRWLVVLLLGSYTLAAFVPGPGVWLRDWDVAAAAPSGEIESVEAPTAKSSASATQAMPIRLSLVLVGVLLLCGSLSIEASKLSGVVQRPGALAIALVGVWAPPLLLVAAWNAVAPWWLAPTDAAALGLGLAMVGAMPVANSAVAWTQQSGGGLAWALGLVVVSISLCPWLAPWSLWLMGLTLTPDDAAAADALVAEFTGAVFVFWVLGPTLLGLVVRWLVGGDRISAWRPTTTLVSAAALLLLNYVNASSALPRVVAEPNWPLLATTLVAAISLPLAGWAAAWTLAPWARLSRRGRVAWIYSLSMKNTGLALGLAGAALGDLPAAVLVILVATLTQHAVAGAAHALGVQTEAAAIQG